VLCLFYRFVIAKSFDYFLTTFHIVLGQCVNVRCPSNLRRNVLATERAVPCLHPPVMHTNGVYSASKEMPNKSKKLPVQVLKTFR